MFKKSISIVITITLLACFFSCAADIKREEQIERPSDSELAEALESKIAELYSAYSLSNADANKKIEQLEKELAALKQTSSNTQTTAPQTTARPSSVFTYRIKNGKAIITGFAGNDDKIVIPSIIDGLEISGIDESAFDGYSFKSVVISEGVEYLDWFAFCNCAYLSSVTIPDSVKSIGYSAFDGTAKGLTIYCHEGSFAERYAKSYGIAYAFI